MREEGHYTIKRVKSLPKEGNSNLLYAIRTDNNSTDSIAVLYRWLSSGSYQTITVGAPGTGDGSETKINSGTNITLTGTGTIADPYIISSTGGGATNLAIGTVDATTVQITSDTGTNATLPTATNTAAGVMPAADKAKVDFITVTQAVDLDAIETDISEHQTLIGVVDGSTDMGTYTGAIITDNQTIKQNMQELEVALGALVIDGNETPVVRGDAITGTEPTVGEVPSPISGDTASVFLTDGTLEKWVHNGTIWALAYTLTAQAAGNLGYTASATNGIITSSTGTDATIPVSTTTNAGLHAPADKTKVDFISITQAVDLDQLEAESANLVTLTGQASDAVDLGTGFTGTTIPDNSTITSALQAIETTLEAISGVTNLAYTVSPTNGIITSDTGTNATISLVDGTNAGLMLPADKTKSDFITVTQAVDLDDIEANQNDLITLTGIAENVTDLGTFTGSIIPDNLAIKPALQAIELEIEGNDLLLTSSTITASRDMVLTDDDGVNDSTAATDVTVTIVDNATVPLPVGSVLLYKRSGAGNVIITGGVGVTMPTYQTYSLDDTISIRKIATDTWEFFNPPKDTSNKYSQTFVVADWTTQSITITAVTHGRGTDPIVQVYSGATAPFTQVEPQSISVAANGDVTLTVGVGLEIDGKVIIL